MAYSPIAFTAPNYRDYNNWWLKAYEPGTTTPKPEGMATDSTLTTFIAKAQLSADGFIISAGGALIIPYIDGTYDLWLFPTEAEADANDTSNALRFADKVTGVNGDLISNRVPFSAKTLDEAVNETNQQIAKEDSLVYIEERTTGNGGGALWKYVDAATVTPNTFNIVQCIGVPALALVLTIDGDIKASQFGGNAAALQAAIDYSLANNYKSILIDTLVDTTGTTLIIDKGVQYTEGGNAFARKRLDFKGAGIGEIRKTDTGFMFSATSGRNGDIGFDNITLSGNVDTPFPTIVTGLNCFDCDKLIRLSITNCVFRNFDRVFSQVGSASSAMQSVKSVNNTYTKNLAVMVFNQAWDVVFDGGLMEDGSKFITSIGVNSTCRNLTISNGATIEGMTDIAIELNCVNYGTAINNCYFEANLQHIQMNRFNGSVDIIGNTFFGRGNIPAGNTIKCIDVAVGEQRVTVDGNMSTETNTNTILISVDEASAFNSARYNLLGSNFTLGSTLTDTDLRLIDKNNITNDTTRGVDFGITADVSSVQGGRPLTASINEISVCANAGDAVTLLPAVSGLKQTIINNGANTCDVFPNAGDNLGAGANTPVGLAPGANITYQCYDFSTNWVALA